MDLNGNGDLSLHEFHDGLDRLKIPWQLICKGKSILQLFKLFDADDSGDIDITELVGHKYYDH
ncbi:hypothetical protein Pmar_PMAR012458 [Perkinsus marinus ATCC 50983]|uniref:EF-hand domain-containing protein n=1 Tax=Perkinsus marinus (strain ATCC 50983 / TXsc) TaxID=423536 RepID=C5K7E2_PERM5|nr:hypothetical protein Pmar_PMAR012458 [Perkinsus marinus ATCC 50983]EER19477.1 hypothetical protein Pmar_PMAR012458 [Perkinsus marinus ATCC 50983]|eukprot:XP_002787681.1 hypothetical protein Pmar_PMAR012458 [Perkinsus marinus ATCC 50983]